MAVMIPREIKDVPPNSREDDMFDALRKLSDDYTVFHSYKILEFSNNCFGEYESDFIVYHEKYGCLLIEAKNGKLTRDTNGNWFYANGKRMKDPFTQVSSTMHAIINKFKEIAGSNSELVSLVKDCKFMYCVWFPSYSKDEIKNLKMPNNIYNELILTKEDLINPSKDIARIMITYQMWHVIIESRIEKDESANYKHKLDKVRAKQFFNKFLVRYFDVIPGQKKDAQEYVYHQLLESQVKVLNFLDGQKTAAIHGASGTGKTLIALERARRIAGPNSKVLFLCYNKNLKRFLEANNPIDYVDYYTIDGFACSMTKSSIADYTALNTVLTNQIFNDEFPYCHIIIDEAQDFGKEGIPNSSILETLLAFTDLKDNSSCFIFYDKNQLVNSKSIPDVINNVDSKISLYKNCRNTLNIANTAYSVINVGPDVLNMSYPGQISNLTFYKNEKELIEKLNNLLKKLHNEVDKFYTVIITVKGYESSTLYKYVNNGIYKVDDNLGTEYYTSSTFKGLEADNVIVVDIDKNTFNEQNIKKFYVSSSRAKRKLYLFASIEDNEIENIVANQLQKDYDSYDPKGSLAIALSTIIKKQPF